MVQLDDPDQFLSKVRELYASSIQSYDLLHFKDGRVFDRFSTPLLQEGKVDGRVWCFSDITGRMQVETNLRKAKEDADIANQAKSTFLAIMSHEIRTPMNAVQGMVELLRRADLPEKHRNMVETIDSSNKSLIRILNDILDLSKIEDGKIELETDDFNLSHLLNRLLEMSLSKVQEKNLTIDLSLDRAIPTFLHGDHVRLKQVLWNLISNSLKFTDEGSIRVSVEPVAGSLPGSIRLRFSVEDEGIGIQKEKNIGYF